MNAAEYIREVELSLQRLEWLYSQFAPENASEQSGREQLTPQRVASDAVNARWGRRQYGTKI
jgi:hypothetical protein